MWDLIRSIIDNSDSYDGKYMRIKFNSDDDLPSKKTPELRFSWGQQILPSSFFRWMFV